MALLQGVGIQFDETMAGTLTTSGVATAIRLDAQLRIADLDAFLHVGSHRAQLEGTLTFAPLGGALPVHDGSFYLFRPDSASPNYHLIYELTVDGADGHAYVFRGEKTLRDRPAFDPLGDMTRLAVTIYRGAPEGGDVYATAEMRFDLADLPKLLESLVVTGASGPWEQVAARVAFLSFAYGTLREEYLGGLRPVYDTRYENVVVQGKLRSACEARPFFLVAGVHDRGFPWGDGELFWDVLLLVGDGADGYVRYAITDRYLTGLDLDVARGKLSFDGPIFQLDGTTTSFTQMRRGEGVKAGTLRLEVAFAPKEREVAGFPFRDLTAHLPSWTTKLTDAVQELLPATHPLGIWITPYLVENVTGTVHLEVPAGVEDWGVQTAGTFGEAERSTFRNVREPTLLYHYLCAVDPVAKSDCVQIDARTLRDERLDWAKDRFDALVGRLVTRMASAEMVCDEDGRVVRPLRGVVPDSSEVAERLVKIGPPLLQVDNDHFPTAIFQRAIVQVADRTGHTLLALEEDMRTLRLEPINSTEKVKVAAIVDDDKRHALDAVLDQTGFDATLAAAVVASGKAKADFQIAIKPNFMFAYSKHDPSTFTDPELVAHLAQRLRTQGYSRIKLVEAQSAYGEYFDKRSVKEMADYLGYTGLDDDGSTLYEVVDLTLDDSDARDFGPPLGLQPVPHTWRDADFRISFGKNKTHAYAYYTLTLKNIYGSLPMAAKFREYHCQRGIYETTMQWLTAFPVHFGLVDAYLSADGPFGVFADPLPNPTRTILGGPSLVAVDWVGASKMGIDPMVSEFMKLAVKRWGKPEIELVGEATVYRPWLNVPPVMTWFASQVVDANYGMGNLFYALMANMDATHFTPKNQAYWYVAARLLTKPIRDALFVQTGERPTLANRAAAWLQTRLGN